MQAATRGGYSVVILVDQRGWLLVQHRDEHAEETGVALGDGLRHWLSEPFRWSDGSTPDDYHFWSAATTLTDDDIELGEGLAIVFVDPAVAPRLDLTESAAHFLPRFLSSERYLALARAAGRP